jgi:hypothetical protein
MKAPVVAALCCIALNACEEQSAAERQVTPERLASERPKLEAEKAALERARLDAERATAAKAAAQLTPGIETVPCPPQQRVMHYVDLDRPGALAELERGNPKHFAALQVALRSPMPRLGEMATWMRTRMNACEFSVTQIYKTSDPPQATVSFIVDDTRYRKTMYIDTLPRP